MKEPDWNALPDKFNRSSRVGDIVWVRKKTRGRFAPSMTKAQPGDHGLVISGWLSSMGSLKINLVTANFTELATTDSCAQVIGTTDTMPEWADHRLRWMEKTFVPVIVVREVSNFDRTGKKFVQSRNGGAVLVKPIGSKASLWVNHDKCHPDDWAKMLQSSEKCHSLRIPRWIVKKHGIF